MNILSISEQGKRFLAWLPLLYVITVAGFHFDGWYHTVVGRDEFWIAPHIFIILGQLIHTVVAYGLMRVSRSHERSAIFLRTYLFIQLVFFIGLGFDEWWHRIIGEETIDTPLVFWGPPHFVIAASLLISPFFLGKMITDAFRGSQKTALYALTFGTLLAFINFYFYPLWPFGPFRIVGPYGQVIMIAGLGFVFSWALRRSPIMPGASLLTLIFLSLSEVMSWGSFADVPRVHELFGAPAYPFWLSFFSFFLAAILLDLMIAFSVRSPVIKGLGWGGMQAVVYYIGAKLWVDLSPYSLFEGWKFFPGIMMSWDSVFFLALLGSLGGAIGFSLARLLEKDPV